MYIKTINNEVLKVASLTTLKTGTFYKCHGGARNRSISQAEVIEIFTTLKAAIPAILGSENFKDDYIIVDNQPQWIWG